LPTLLSCSIDGSSRNPKPGWDSHAIDDPTGLQAPGRQCRSLASRKIGGDHERHEHENDDRGKDAGRHGLPRQVHIPGIKGRGVRIRPEWSPEQLATTPRGPGGLPKGFAGGAPSTGPRVRLGRRILDLEKRVLVDPRDGSEETLAASEYDLLKVFAENPNRPLNRDWLLEVTSHREMGAFDRSIDLRITRLRRKIEVDPGRPEAIRTVRGVGYMFVPPRD